MPPLLLFSFQFALKECLPFVMSQKTLPRQHSSPGIGSTFLR